MSILNNIWFTADTHFGHEQILHDERRGTNRPFSSVQEMDEELIDNWNTLVKSQDTIYILGDFAVKNVEKYAKRLNGTKILVRGNHDPDSVPRGVFISVYDILDTRLDRDIVMCHYPLLEWNGCYRGVLHLHGHVHGKWLPVNSEDDLNRIDVGVDTNNFFPYSLEEIFDTVKGRRYEMFNYRED